MGGRCSWTDNQNILWLFGGEGLLAVHLNGWLNESLEIQFSCK